MKTPYINSFQCHKNEIAVLLDVCSIYSLLCCHNNQTNLSENKFSFKNSEFKASFETGIQNFNDKSPNSLNLGLSTVILRALIKMNSEVINKKKYSDF